MPKNEMLEPTSEPIPEIVKAFIAGCIECDGHINLAVMPMGNVSGKEEGEILLRYGSGTRYGQGGQHTISIEERYEMALRVRELHQGARP